MDTHFGKLKLLVRNVFHKYNLLVILSNGTNFQSPGTQNIILTTNQDLILAQHFQKSFLLLAFSDDLSKISKIMTDNYELESKVILVTESLDLRDIFQKSLDLAILNIGVFQLNFQKFFTFDDLKIFKKEKYLETLNGEFKVNKYPKNFYKFPMSVLYYDKSQLEENFTWNYCQFIHFFGNKFNIFVNATEYTETQPTINLNQNFLNSENETFSYFQSFQTVSLIGPLNKEENLYFYYLIPFTYDIWTMTLVLIILVSILFSISNFQSIGFNFTTVIGIFFTQILPLEKSTILNSILFNFMLLFGKLMTNLYCLNMSSILIQTLKNEKFPIIGFPNIVKRLGKTSYGINVVDEDEYWQNYYSLNMTLGYCMMSSVWEKIQIFQEKLHEPLFRPLLPWRRTSVPYGFVIQRNSIFRSLFNKLYMDAHEFGFMKKWTQDESRFSNVVPNLPHEEQLKAFTINDLLLPFECLGLGCFIAFIWFLKEIIWFHF